MNNFDKAPNKENLIINYQELIKLVFTRDSGKFPFESVPTILATWIINNGGKISQNDLAAKSGKTLMIRGINPVNLNDNGEKTKYIEIENFIRSLLPVQLNSEQELILKRILTMTFDNYFEKKPVSYIEALEIEKEFRTLFNID